jgi:hypothetical protein
MVNDRYLYASDIGIHAVKRWKMGDPNETVVAGVMDLGIVSIKPIILCTIPSIKIIQFVSEANNNRVTKWTTDAKEGIVVAGGQDPGNNLTQLSYPHAIIVDQLGTLYVADCSNNQVVLWLKGATQGSVLVGGNG